MYQGVWGIMGRLAIAALRLSHIHTQGINLGIPCWYNNLLGTKGSAHTVASYPSQTPGCEAMYTTSLTRLY